MANGGQIAGASLVNTTTTRAFRYQYGVMQALGSLGGANSAALGMNDAGEVVGYAQTPQTPPADYWNPGHAFLFNEDINLTSMVDLGSDERVALQSGAAPHIELPATAINSDAQVVGYAVFGPN
jgi:probable HAF family extracellular repeat protein